MKNILLIFAMSFFGTLFAQKDITSEFKLKWKANVGLTTYRTNILEQNGFVYVGSNGNAYKSNNDDKDGVFKINAKSGKIERIYHSKILGDNDVTGIAISNDKLYFGTDNYYFYCFDEKGGNELWKYPTKYDVESTPVLTDLNNDGSDDVLFSVQENGVVALDGLTGQEIWVNDSITCHGGNVAPLLVDCNGDGIQDFVGGMRGMPNSNKTAGFVMAHYGDYLFAINGKNGNFLWLAETGAGIHASPFLDKETNEICTLDAYGSLKFLSLRGELLKTGGYGFGSFSSPVIYNRKLAVGIYVSEVEPDKYDLSKDGTYKYLTNRSKDVKSPIKGKVSATTMVADILGTGKQQFISVSETGELSIASEDLKILKHLNFPKGAEASVFVKDIDGDGKLELLIASLDGYLYCYETNSKGSAFYGQFRWNNRNNPE